MKNFLKNKMLKRTLLGLSLTIMIVGGVFVYSSLTRAAVSDGICNAGDLTITNPATGTYKKGQ